MSNLCALCDFDPQLHAASKRCHAESSGTQPDSEVTVTVAAWFTPSRPDRCPNVSQARVVFKSWHSIVLVEGSVTQMHTMLRPTTPRTTHSGSGAGLKPTEDATMSSDPIRYTRPKMRAYYDSSFLYASS